MMAAGLFANAFPCEPGSPPAFAGKIQQGDIPVAAVKSTTSGIEQVSTLTAPPVLPVLSGRDQVSPTPSKANRPPDRGCRWARKYHAIMATAWLTSAQPEPIGAFPEIL
jgi:hypothetical protein